MKSLKVNLAFEIVGQLSAVTQGDGRLQFSLPSGGIGYLIPTSHKNKSTRMIIKGKKENPTTPDAKNPTFKK